MDMHTAQALTAFLQHRDFRYCNPAGVTFYRVADGSFFVAAQYPGVQIEANISLDFFRQFDDEKHFMSLVRIGDANRLDEVVVEDLYTLYQNELMDIVCILKGKRAKHLHFRKMGGLLWAISVRKKMHLVRVAIDQPEDFIAYTKRYYKVIDHEQNREFK